ncbi:hypothetical protein L9F63_000359, partial [Diploptera punctata]
ARIFFFHILKSNKIHLALLANSEKKRNIVSAYRFKLYNTFKSFEKNYGASLDDGKLEDLKSDSH